MEDMIEDQLVLRVPDALSERVQNAVKPKGDVEAIKLEQSKSNANEWVFQIGSDKYYATLRELPTVVESLKTKKTQGQDSGVFYKSGQVSHVLEVSNTKIEQGPRPQVEVKMDDGLTPPMAKARSERFRRLDRSIKHGLPQEKENEKSSEKKKLVMKMDDRLSKIMQSLNDNVEEITLEHCEEVEMEPFMHYWGQETIIKQGNDNFLSEARKAYDAAYDAYLKKNGGVPASSTSSSLQSLLSKANKSGPKPTSTQPLSPPLKPSTPPASKKPSPAPPPKTTPTFTFPKATAKPSPSPKPTVLGVTPPPGPTPSPPVPSPSPSPVGMESDANTTPGPLLGGVTPGGISVVTPGVATPGETPGGATPGVATPGTPSAATPNAGTPSATPGLPQPSPSASPGVYGDEQNPEVAKLLAELNDLKEKQAATLRKFQENKQKATKERNAHLRKVIVDKMKGLKAEGDEIAKSIATVKENLKRLREQGASSSSSSQ